MKHQLEKLVGQTVALQTEKGIAVGVLEKVTDKGVYLKALPKKDRHGLDVEHVFFGGGFFPGAGFGFPGRGFFPGAGFGFPGVGFGGVGFGAGVGVGVGVGAGFGFGVRRPFFW